MDCSTFAFDLHVLGTPPALILSQDQTLMLNSLPAFITNGSRRSQQLPDNLFNARPIWLLRCSIRFNEVVRRQPPLHGLTTPVGRFRGATR